MARSRPTIRDVAARAGVSHQTVSRVINNSAPVTPETRARVAAAITELGYQPNAIARSLADGRTRTLACISPNLTDYTFARIIEGAETEARQHGYFVISSSAPDAATFAGLVEQLITSRRTEGLMVINPYIDDRLTHLPQKFPTVIIGARSRTDAPDSVALDDVGAAQAAMQHLIDLGHTRIAMISGPIIEDCVQDRNTGYQAALQAAGIQFDPALVIEGDWSASSSHAAFAQLFDRAVPPTAIFAQNDRMALGALRAARDRGLSVPDQIAVIGIDDMPLASYFDPPLTTMRQDMFAIGREAARLLLRAIDKPQTPRQHLRLPAELVVRKSTNRSSGL
jgi:DNA-binding LacI/PurR family transcriptional regulator